MISLDRGTGVRPVDLAGPFAVARIARPVRLEQVPLLGRAADEHLELAGQVLGDPGDVLARASPALDGQRRADDAVVAVEPSREVHATGRIGAPVRSASVAGPAGSVVRSPKNSTSTPLPLEVAVAEQADDLRCGRGPARSPAGRPVRAAPRSCRGAPASSANHSNSSGGSSGSTTTVMWWPCVGHPAPGPLPAAEVRQGEDHALARGERRQRRGRVAVERRGRGRPCGRQRRQAEALHPVAGVGVERLLDRAANAAHPRLGSTRRRWRSIIARRPGASRWRRTRSPSISAVASARAARARAARRGSCRPSGGRRRSRQCRASTSWAARRPGQVPLRATPADTHLRHAIGAGHAARWRRRAADARCAPRRPGRPPPGCHTLTNRWTAVTDGEHEHHPQDRHQQRAEQQAEARAG